MSDDSTAISILQASLKEAQDGIRTYDTKAQICSVGYIFALGLVANIAEHFDSTPADWNQWTTLAAWILVICPVIMFGYVLYPSRKMAPKLRKPPEDIQRSVYFDTDRFPSLEEYVNATKQSDWQRELAFEIMKVSLLREVKRKRFLAALFFTLFSFLFIFVSQFLKSAGVPLG